MAAKSTIFIPGARLANLSVMGFRVLTVLTVISFLSLSSCKQSRPDEVMPVTTGSELARELFETAMVAFDQIKREVAYHNLELAVREDPEFFMAYFWMYIMGSKGYSDMAEKALHVDADLNQAEKALQTALKYQRGGQDKRVLQHMEEAIGYYPADPNLYKLLYIYQWFFTQDGEGAMVTIRKAIEAIPDHAFFYNLLGYGMMEQGDYKSAEMAFDTYLRLAPGLANPYDSRGDFYMETGQYGKAYESYMKAYSMDPGFTVSEKKARKARSMMEQSEK